MASNYGDIRLGLSPEWDRRKVFNKQFIDTTIGHRNGVAEVRLENNPEQQHAFAWVDPTPRQDSDDVGQNLDDGYTFVNKNKGWVADRWNWDAEGFLVARGQRLMAITAERWAELERERSEQFTAPGDPVTDELLEKIAKTDAEVELSVPRKRAGRR